ncbi:MAG: PepSY-associated TM helix domain-containing protein [Gallionella sp.]|nr:PepSY-associated TM helix domain-containing protein [Gallionella sp.]MDD4945981.1 PepSY-associated TM helix domain-containing protein [Gallionella sp.]
MRNAIVYLHRWVGLAVLAFVGLAAITGTILAFDKELDGWLNDDWYTVLPQGERLSMDALVPAAEKFYPGKRVTFVRTGEEASSAYQFYLRTPAAKGDDNFENFFKNNTKYHQVFINPYTAEVLGGRVNGEVGLDKRHLIGFLLKLHYTLILGDFGKWLMGIAALLWLVDHFGAVYLSFPKLKAWKKSFAFRWNAGGHKLNFDMHRSGSMWILPVLIALALSSVYLNLNTQFKWVVNKFSPVTKVECACHVDPNAKWLADTASWQGAIALAQQTKPDLRVGGLTFLPDTRKFIVSMKGSDDLTAEVGMTKVYVNAITGELMHVHDRADETAADTFLAWMLPLHSGRVFGLIGQIIILLSGIVITIICVTGYLIYARKAKAREAKAVKPVAEIIPVIQTVSESNLATPTTHS